MEIKYKEWDSLNFGFKVGELYIDSNDLNEIYDLLCQYKIQGYRLIYIHSNILQNVKNLFYDEKITFSKKREHYSPVVDECIRRANITDLKDEIYSLAVESGRYSRYNLDPNFPNDKFIMLYKKWIENSIYKQIATDVYIYINENSNSLGLITYKTHDNISNIGIISTSIDMQGKGIGSKLIKYYESNLPEYIKEIEVITQGVNIPAMSFYKKNGYKVKSIEYIYHAWL